MKKLIRKMTIPLLAAASIVGSCDALADGFLIGGGVGVPYGIAGVKLAYDFDVAGALTISPTLGGGIGGDAGLQIFFGEKTSGFRPGVGVWQGTNGLLKDYSGNYHTLTGTTVGFTSRLQYGNNQKHIVEVHLLYLSSTDMSTYCGSSSRYSCSEEGGKVKGGIGYSYHF